MTNPEPFVWVQLYYEGKEEPDGQVVLIKPDGRPVEITPLPRNVDALAKALKKELKLDAPLHKMYVYSPGTKPRVDKQNSIDPGKTLEDLIAEYKSKQTPLPTSSAHPLIVVAPPPQQQLAPPTKKQKVLYQFGKKFDRFHEYVNGSINNVADTEIYERDDVEQAILNKLQPMVASPKPNCVTIWSGRGSGKTSLIRKITTSSQYLQAARDCGRLMIIDAKRDNVKVIPEELKSQPTQIYRFLVTLVGYHLCKIFLDSSVDGVDFTSAATIEDLWNHSDTLPPSLVAKLHSIRSGTQAYDWWRSCTKSFISSEDGDGPNPVIFIDTAESLAVVNDIPTPKDSPNKNYAVSTRKDSAVVFHISNSDRENMPNPHPHKHQSKETRYLVLEWLMMCIPNDHLMVAFGTGQTRDLSAPLELQTNVNHNRLAPLNALSEEAAARLYCQLTQNLPKGHVVTNPLDDLNDEQLRIVRTVYAVTAGIPRMLVHAFSSKTTSLTSSMHEVWENEVLDLYQDVSMLVSDEKLSVQCLAKAIIISAVCDVWFDDFISIPGEVVTWNKLRWWSIAFLTSRDGGKTTRHCYRIPRLLWHKEAKRIYQWTEDRCKFNVHDLLPTIKQLYNCTGNAAATASGTAWEKMFASALVARFFSLCWLKGLDPPNAYIGLDELLPQKEENLADMKTLERVEVCLAKGISVNAEREVFASKATLEEADFDHSAIHANWEHRSAHHDLVLPVRLKEGDRKMLFAVSARNGHHKTEADLLKTKQHLVNKIGTEEKVEGIIQALNPRRRNQPGRRLEKEFKELTEDRKYAEVVFTEGHVHYVLGCFT